MGGLQGFDLDHHLALVLIFSSAGTHINHVLPCQSGGIISDGLWFRRHRANASPSAKCCESMVMEVGDLIGLCSAILHVIYDHEVDHLLDARLVWLPVRTQQYLLPAVSLSLERR